jgi:hypothetical protein
MRLIENWKESWRLFSVWCFGAAGLLQAIWLSLTPDERALIPESYAHWITLAVAVIGIVGRVIKQKPLPECAQPADASKPLAPP